VAVAVAVAAAVAVAKLSYAKLSWQTLTKYICKQQPASADKSEALHIYIYIYISILIGDWSLGGLVGTTTPTCYFRVINMA